jgi:hypothetical protein
MFRKQTVLLRSNVGLVISISLVNSIPDAYKDRKKYTQSAFLIKYSSASYSDLLFIDWPREKKKNPAELGFVFIE